MRRRLPEKARNVKVLIFSAIVLAVFIIVCAIWISTAGGSSGYKTQTISTPFGQQLIRTKGSSAQLCTDGKWVPIEISGGQISFPPNTRLIVGEEPSCSNSSGAPLIAEVILIIAAVLELVTLGLLVVAKRQRIVAETRTRSQ